MNDVYNNHLPKYIIINIDYNLPNYNVRLLGDEYPSINNKHLINDIVAVASRHYNDTSEDNYLAWICDNIKSHIYTYDHGVIYKHELYDLQKLILLIYNNITETFKALKLYIDGVTPYQFKQLLNDKSIILELL